MVGWMGWDVVVESWAGVDCVWIVCIVCIGRKEITRERFIVLGNKIRVSGSRTHSPKRGIIAGA